MRSAGFFAAVALLWAQPSSPSWGRAQIDSARSIIPDYIVSPVAQTNTRLPYFAVLHLTGLEPNTTYRYVPRMDNATTAPPSLNINLGAGNPILYDASTNSWSISTSPSLQNAGGYSTITTDNNGEATLLFGIQPTGNQRFRTDGGNKVYVKVFLLSDSGPVDSAYVIGDKTPIQPLSIRATSCTVDTCGSFVYDSALVAPNSLVFLYRTYGAHQPGERPLAGAIVENTGIAWGGSQLSSYVNQVAGKDRRYGTVLPNTLPTGVQAIHYFVPNSGGLQCNNAIFDTDGTWPGSGISTVNPTNGGAAVGLLNSPVYPLLPKPSFNTCLNVLPNHINPSTGNISVNYPLLPTQGFSYGFSIRLSPGFPCVNMPPFDDLPWSLTLADSTNPTYHVYPLCFPQEFFTNLDSVYASTSGGWSSAGMSCGPCMYYQSVHATFYWRCFNGEGGFRVQNFSYFGDESTLDPNNPFYSMASTTLDPLRVPKKIEWITSTLPTGPVQAGNPFAITAELIDSLTPATWASGTPDLSGCSGSITLNLLDANNNLVATFPGSNLQPFPMQTTFAGNWPTTAGTYKLVISPVQLNCNCPGASPGTLNWAGSDTITVTVDISSGLAVHTEVEAWAVVLPQAEGQLLLYNAQGQVVWQAPAEAYVRIPRHTLADGLYTLVWHNKRSVSARKLMQP